MPQFTWTCLYFEDFCRQRWTSEEAGTEDIVELWLKLSKLTAERAEVLSKDTAVILLEPAWEHRIQI